MEYVGKEIEEIRDADLDARDKTLSEAESDDNVVGEVPLDLRKLLVLARQYKKQSAEAVIAAKYATEEEKIDQNNEVALESKTKSSLLSEIFWASIRDIFDLWGEGNSSLGVKKGWKVVVYAEDDQKCGCLGCTLARMIVEN